MPEDLWVSAGVGPLSRLYACLITPDGDGWLGTVPDVPGLEIRGRTAYDVELAIPRALAEALPSKPPRPVARLTWAAPAGRRAPLPPSLPLEASRAARSAIRGLLACAAPVPVDLAHQLLGWDRELADLESAGPSPRTRVPALGLGLVTLPSDGGRPETVAIGRDADGLEVALFVLDPDD